MEYKIFKVIYNDGGWHSGPLPYFYYIAQNEEELIANSARYADFVRRKKLSNGDIWIFELNEIDDSCSWENIKDFEIKISIKAKVNNE